MKKNSDTTPLKPALCFGDAGMVFTVAILGNLIVSLVFSLSVSVIAVGHEDTEAYLKGLQDTFTYQLFSYGLSSVALCLSLLAFAKHKKHRPFSPVSYKNVGYKTWLFAALLVFGLLFGFTEINNLFADFLKNLGYNKTDMTILNEEWWQYLIWIVVAAALPAFLEESLFRGYMAEGMKSSTVFAVLVGGLAFSLFHQNPQQTPYQFICGAAYFLVAVKCGSALPSIVMHFINNFVILSADFFNFNPSGTASIILTVCGLVAFCVAIAYFIIIKKPAKNSSFQENTVDNLQQSPIYRAKTGFFLLAAVGFAACGLTWVSDLVTFWGA